MPLITKKNLVVSFLQRTTLHKEPIDYYLYNVFFSQLNNWLMIKIFSFAANVVLYCINLI